MERFSEDQIKRQDFVGNQIFDLVKRIIRSTKELEWDIEMIGGIRDTIQHSVRKKIISVFLRVHPDYQRSEDGSIN